MSLIWEIWWARLNVPYHVTIRYVFSQCVKMFKSLLKKKMWALCQIPFFCAQWVKLWFTLFLNEPEHQFCAFSVSTLSKTSLPVNKEGKWSDKGRQQLFLQVVHRYTHLHMVLAVQKCKIKRNSIMWGLIYSCIKIILNSFKVSSRNYCNNYSECLGTAFKMH